MIQSTTEAPVVEMSETTETTETTEDTTKSETPEMSACELLAKGKELTKATNALPIGDRDYDCALDNFSKALEKIVSEKGELHFDCAAYYLEYGKTLLESSKTDGNMFARIEQQQKGDKVMDTGEEEKQQVGGPSDDKTEEKPSTSEEAPAATSEETPATTSEETDAVAAAAEAAGTTSKEEDGGDGEAKPKSGKAEAVAEESKTPSEEYVEPRQLAWELFESTRVILTKSEKTSNDELSKLHRLLGETAMEDGNFERSYKEYVEAIKVLGKEISEADPRLAECHQLAGMCALYDQQMEAATYHYTAAAEGFNNQLVAVLLKHEIMEKPKEESDMIDFVDEALLAKLEEKLGKEHKDTKTASELNSLMNSLIERVNEVQNQEEEDAANPEIQTIVRGLAAKLAEKFGQAAAAGDGKTAATTSNGFDKPAESEGSTAFDKSSDGSASVNLLVPKKRPCPVSSADEQPARKIAKLGEDSTTTEMTTTDTTAS